MNDDMRIKKLTPEEEEAAAAAASGAIPSNYTLSDYREWQNIKEDLSLMGIESTGNYQQDLQIMNDLRQIDEIELDRAVEEKKIQNNRATENVTKLTNSDEDQAVKSNVANSQSQTIIADLMKYYHRM